ncbi:polysaccharide pyruvyl transferase family protein [Flavobacterium sp.]|jgi:polysaccharide pyruvyl transferase WcaK-like protein|uniref:polysaccharide pyruvyl transferase family protein n=1 Tax=Flavobacterium sp. TaxID=239 RepID=UPI0037BF262E
MNGDKKIVHFLSASDRINYGDLLFPILFKSVLESRHPQAVFINYAVVKSDFSEFGALPTASYLSFQKQVKLLGGSVVVGGGEVFFTEWRTLYSYISPIYYRLLKNRYFKKLNAKIDFAKIVLSNNKVAIPFCPSLDELENDNLNLFFSSVGGVFFGNKEKPKNIALVKTLKKSSLLSVRDQRSYDSMKLFGLDPKLVPDSAIIMSDIFSQESLYAKTDLKNLKDKKYLFFQLGRYKSPTDLIKFTTQLKSIGEKLNLEVVLCPIGLAPGHEDDIILHKIYKLDASFLLVKPKNIYDIMFAISNASLYVGTSLHGLITAQSFGKPYVGLNKNLTKLDSYLKTWTDKAMGCIDFESLEEIVPLYENWNFDLRSQQLLLQKQMVYSNLELMMSNDK